MYNWFVRCNDRLPKTTLVLVESRDRIIAEKAFKERKLHFYSYGGKLPVDFNKPIISPWSVAVVALQLGIFLNIKEIYLLGIDHDWQSLEDYAHFYSHEKESLEYFASKENVHFTYDRNALRSPKSRLYREYELYQQYELLGEYASNLGIKIFNGDRSSGFDVYNHSYNWMR
ncbi:MAG: hypothetical protein ABF251_09955 [Nonlabens sp.]